MAGKKLVIDESNPLFAKFLEMEREAKLEKFSSVPEIKMLMELHSTAKTAIEKYTKERERLYDVVKANEGAAELLPLFLFNSGVTIQGTRTRSPNTPMGDRWVAVSGALTGNAKPIPPAMKKKIADATSIDDLPPAAERHKLGIYTLPEMAEGSGLAADIVSGLLVHKDYDKHFEKVRDGQKGKNEKRVPPVWHLKTT